MLNKKKDNYTSWYNLHSNLYENAACMTFNYISCILGIILGPPQNVTVVLSANELLILWKEPARGLTKSVIQHYSIECFSQNSVNDTNYTYSIRAIRDNGTYHIQLPVDVNAYVNYNCCVEVNFETYSSVACDSARLVTIKMIDSEHTDTQLNFHIFISC